MKKILSIILTIIIFVSIFSFNASATVYDKTAVNEIVVSETTVYFEDDSSITTTITQQINDIETLATTKTVSGSKIHTAKNADGEVMYKFKITGTFTVNIGVSATCTAVSCSASDCTNGWGLDSYTTSKLGNTAKATGTFKKKTLFITTNTINVPLTLSCDANGVLS